MKKILNKIKDETPVIIMTVIIIINVLIYSYAKFTSKEKEEQRIEQLIDSAYQKGVEDGRSLQIIIE